MKRSMLIALTLLFAFSLSALAAGPGMKSPGYREPGQKDEKKKQDKPAPAKDSKEKSFSEMVKDRTKIEGFFTFYHDTTDNTVLMAIRPDQMGPIYLCNETRSQAEGAFFDNGTLTNSFPFYFKQVGKKVMMMEKNLRFRADSTSELRRAVASGISDHLFASLEVKSKPADDSTKAILVDMGDLFIRDAENSAFFLNQGAKTGVSFDSKNSYFEKIKSFPENSEVTVKLHYRTSQPIDAPTMQNPYSFFHTYHYSLSGLPKTDYVPRIADDRVGHFLTIYEDYSTLDQTSPYVRYVERWNLKKKDPSAAVSEPVEPIIYWVENTVPVEYREAVKRGIEYWQPAFEKAGFKNAIIAQQMPDTASWDPADVRYNTVRWILMPGGGYAVGPSRANPFTGQIYDADIRISADFIRYMFNNMEYFISPVSHDGRIEEKEEMVIGLPHNDRFCNYGDEGAREAAFGLSYILSSTGDFANKDSLTREYVNAYIVELVAHEVGHTLGFRHNFKASTIHSLDQINDRSFTTVNGTIGTCMDYAPPNIAGKGKAQGEFYCSTPGPYDNWVIEYAYRDYGAKTPQDELPQLRTLAAKAAEAGVVYGTDEDNFGNGTKGIDPLCNLFDLGNDPIRYAEHKLGLTKELWRNSLNRFEQNGDGYQEVFRAFSTGWRSYSEAVVYSSKWIGGIHHNRLHVGDKAGTLPMTPVPAADQRRAMEFLKTNIFAANAFSLPADVLNKLQPERFPDFQWSVYDVPQVDYPFMQMALSIQNSALNRLYSPLTTGRLVSNVQRYQTGEAVYTLFDMFSDVRKAIWTEAITPANVNGFRRQLQLVHLNYLSNIYLSQPGTYPSDAVTLAANDLNLLKSAAQTAAASPDIDGMSRAHFREVVRQINATTDAQRNYRSAGM